MEHLFVYGTLLSGAEDALGAAMRARLAREASFLGPASMPGRLYDLGDYPGMIEVEPRSRTLVAGEVIQLHDAATTFNWLDDYEDVDPTNPAAGLYRRVPQLALLNDGRGLRCWAYVLNQSPAKESLIAGGCWLSHSV